MHFTLSHYFPLLMSEYSVTLPVIIHVLSLIDVSTRPVHKTQTIHFVLFPQTFVNMTLRILVLSIAMMLTPVVLSIVAGPIIFHQMPFPSELFPLQRALVLTAKFENDLPLPVRFVFFPLAFVGLPDITLAIDDFSIADSFTIANLAGINTIEKLFIDYLLQGLLTRIKLFFSTFLT